MSWRVDFAHNVLVMDVPWWTPLDELILSGGVGLRCLGDLRLPRKERCQEDVWTPLPVCFLICPCRCTMTKCYQLGFCCCVCGLGGCNKEHCDRPGGGDWGQGLGCACLLECCGFLHAIPAAWSTFCMSCKGTTRHLLKICFAGFIMQSLDQSF